MTSTNDGKDVKSNQTSGHKGKTYYIELYKSLDAALNAEGEFAARAEAVCAAWRRVHALCVHSAPPTHPHLLAWIQRHTARTVLQSEWQSPKSRNEQIKLEEAIDFFIEESEAVIESKDGVALPWESQLLSRAEWFKSVLSNPWGHPVLKVLLDPNGQEPTTEEILEWLKAERGVVFVARLRQLALSKCNDLALTLVTAVMDRVRQQRHVLNDLELYGDDKVAPPPESSEPTFETILSNEAGFAEVWDMITDMEFVLLHKSDKSTRLIDLAKLTPLSNGYQLVERLLNRLDSTPCEKKLWKNAKDVATLISQVLIARCMVVPWCGGAVRTALYWSCRALARVLPRARLPRAAAALAAPAATARHLHTLASAVHAQQSVESEELKPFVVELYVRAITFGMNELEKHKLDTTKEKEARAMEQTLASWFIQLGQQLAASARMRCECTLTAFSVHPTPAMYERIKTAPTLPPVALDIQEPKILSAEISTFGSWANDSRTKTNFVKTSETLNIKHQPNQHQANVLSTAILTEGEMLGLGAELCQDIAVLLSGPRVKTLSWDMDREILLENCRTYMERTHGGTRALTTELKYLNLDPSQFQHLPEEEDDENNVYYGIEKGYEHLVEFQEPQPEEIWEDALCDPERTESVCSDTDSYIEVKQKKKSKHHWNSSECESDPLSLVPETKRPEKKKERPLSKERSKEMKKKHKDEHKEHADRRKAKKKEKKERKKKEKLEAKSQSMKHLVGKKVSIVTAIEDNNIFITDSDYDSQGKSSWNSEGNDADVLYDGQFSMDELKSPDHKSPDKINKTICKNNELSGANGQTVNKIQNIQKPEISNTQKPLYANSPISNKPEQGRSATILHATKNIQETPATSLNKNVQDVREEVKKSISKLIQFRRQKATEVNSKTLSSPNQVLKIATTTKQSQSSPSSMSHYIGLKVPNPGYTQLTKKQSEQLNAMKNEVKTYTSKPLGLAINYPNKDKVNKSRVSQANSTCSRVQPIDMAYVRKMQPQNQTSVIRSPQSKIVTNNKTLNQFDQQQTQLSLPQLPVPLQSSSHLNSYQEFLKDLQKSTNAGLERSQSTTAIYEKRKEIIPISKVASVGQNLVKTEPTVSPQCAKPIVQQKKAENAPNTFARLSYMHKNKHIDKPKSSSVNMSTSLQHSISAELDKRIADLRNAKMQMTQSPLDAIKPRSGSASMQAAQSKVPAGYELSKVESHPTLSNIFKGNTAVTIMKKLNHNHQIQQKNTQTDDSQSNTAKLKNTSLTEKDQQDILQLLGQQNVLNLQITKGKVHASKVISNLDKMGNTDLTNKYVTGSTIHLQGNKNTGQVTPAKEQDQIEEKKGVPMQFEGFKFPVISDSSIKKTVELIQNTKIQARPSNSKVKVKASQNSAIKKVVSELDTMQKPLECNKVVTKKYVPKPPIPTFKREEDTQTQDWTSVLDALRAHKTPSRGPNALDMIFKRDSFEKVNERNQRIKERLEMETKTNKNPNTTIQHTVPIKPTISTVTKQDFSVTKKKTMDCTPKRQISTVTKKTSTIMPLILYPEVTTQPPPPQQPQLQKEADPFISGIPNSDYEILEELMDDDLRQEIGELSSDEESYRPPASTPPKTVKQIDSSAKINKMAVQNKSKIEIDANAVYSVRAKPQINTLATSSQNAQPKIVVQNKHQPEIEPRFAYNCEASSQKDTLTSTSLNVHPQIAVQNKLKLDVDPGFVLKVGATVLTSTVQTKNPNNTIHIKNKTKVNPRFVYNVGARPQINALASTSQNPRTNITVQSKHKPEVDARFMYDVQAKPQVDLLASTSQIAHPKVIVQNNHRPETIANFVFDAARTKPLINALTSTSQNTHLKPCIISNEKVDIRSIPENIIGSKVIRHAPKGTPITPEPVAYNTKTSVPISSVITKTLNTTHVIENDTAHLPVHNVVVYDPYAMGCVSMNNTASINIYQEQCSASIVNAVIIGMQHTLTIPVPNAVQCESVLSNMAAIPASTTVSDASAMTNPDELTENHRNKTIDTTDKQIPDSKLSSKAQDIVATDSQITNKADINLNHTCERRVLSEVQEKLTVPAFVAVEKVDQKVSFDGEKKTQVTSEQERLTNKRMALENRDIYHRCFNAPIPLTYTPLIDLEASKIDGNESIRPEKMDSEKRITETKTVSADKVSLKVNNKDSSGSENAKENTDLPLHDRIFLRSTNKLSADVSVNDNILRNSGKSGRKTKVRLKVSINPKEDKFEEKLNTDVTKEVFNQKTDIKVDEELNDVVDANSEATTNFVRNKIVPTRASKRILDKKVEKSKNDDEKALVVTKKESSTASKTKTQILNHTEIDIEEALIGSKIPKTPVIVKNSITFSDGTVVAKSENSKSEQIERTFLKVDEKDISSKTSKTETETFEILSSPEIIENNPLSDLKTLQPMGEMKSNKLPKMKDKQNNAENKEPSKPHSELSGEIFSEKHTSKKLDTHSKLFELVKDIESAINVITETTVNSPPIPAIESDILDELTRCVESAEPKKRVSELALFAPSSIGQKDGGNKPSSHKSQIINNKTNSKKDVSIDREINDIPVEGFRGKSSKQTTETNAINTNFKLHKTAATSDKIDSKKKNDVSTNAVLGEPLVQANTKSQEDIRQTLKESINFEEIQIPGNTDPNKRCVRIKLPNKKTFKATVYGKVRVSFDTLFEDPALKDILLNSINEKKCYTLNIQQKKLDSKEDGSKEAVQGKKVIETVNLISDDEEEAHKFEKKKNVVQTINTDDGKYAIKTIDPDSLVKHQQKFLLKCYVKLCRCEEKLRTQSLVDSLPEDLNITTPLNMQNMDDKCDSKLLTPCLMTPMDMPTKLDANITADMTDKFSDVIEIDDSSDCDTGLDLHEKIVEFKNLLLKDLESNIAHIDLTSLQKEEITVEQPTVRNCESVIDSNKTHQPDQQTVQSEIPKNKDESYWEEFLETGDNSDVINTRKCFIKLVRCDSMLKNMSEAQNVQESNKNNITVCENIDDTESALSRSGSFSILNDLNILDEPLEPTDGRSSPVINIVETIISLNNIDSLCSGKTSPVMEVFDAIATLQNNDEVVTPQLSDNLNQPVFCESDWFGTKFNYHSISLINDEKYVSISDSLTDSEINITNSSKFSCEMESNDSSKVPSLISIMSQYFADNPVVYQLTYLTSKMLQLPKQVHSLKIKRKSSDQVDSSSNKITKILDTPIIDPENSVEPGLQNNYQSVHIIKYSLESSQEIAACSTEDLDNTKLPESTSANEMFDIPVSPSILCYDISIENDIISELEAPIQEMADDRYVFDKTVLETVLETSNIIETPEHLVNMSSAHDLIADTDRLSASKSADETITQSDQSTFVSKDADSCAETTSNTSIKLEEYITASEKLSEIPAVKITNETSTLTEELAVVTKTESKPITATKSNDIINSESEELIKSFSQTAFVTNLEVTESEVSGSTESPEFFIKTDSSVQTKEAKSVLITNINDVYMESEPGINIKTNETHVESDTSTEINEMETDSCPASEITSKILNELEKSTPVTEEELQLPNIEITNETDMKVQLPVTEIECELLPTSEMTEVLITELKESAIDVDSKFFEKSKSHNTGDKNFDHDLHTSPVAITNPEEVNCDDIMSKNDAIASALEESNKSDNVKKSFTTVQELKMQTNQETDSIRNENLEPLNDKSDEYNSETKANYLGLAIQSSEDYTSMEKSTENTKENWVEKSNCVETTTLDSINKTIKVKEQVLTEKSMPDILEDKCDPELQDAYKENSIDTFDISNHSNENIDNVDHEIIIGNLTSDNILNTIVPLGDSNYAETIPQTALIKENRTVEDEEILKNIDNINGNSKLVQTDMQDNNNECASPGSEVNVQHDLKQTDLSEAPASSSTINKNLTTLGDLRYIYETEISVEEVENYDKESELIDDIKNDTLISQVTIGRDVSDQVAMEISSKEVVCDVNIVDKNSTLIFKDDTGVEWKGIEYEDPEIGTCYVFPLKSSNITSNDETINNPVDMIEVAQEIEINYTVDDDNYDENNEPYELQLLQPKFTYLKSCLKRKAVMRDDEICRKRTRRNSNSKDSKDRKITERKYRKGKNIDNRKICAYDVANSSYAKEFKRILDYYSTVDFSYALSYSKDFIDVPELLKDWPVNEPLTCKTPEQINSRCSLFIVSENINEHIRDPLLLTLAEEITAKDEDTNTTNNSDIEETNFNMGFGEESGRVIQNLNGGAISKFSAATLSDVKHTQPCLLSIKGQNSEHKLNYLKSSSNTQKENMKRFVSFIELRDKVRSFFMNNTIQLACEQDKNVKKDRSCFEDRSSFPFDLYVPKCIEPRPIETLVQVVQVGQLPVSAAAQNPVTCDPRVTQVSDASPSQCSVGNSPNDDSQQEIKTEYTELTTAELSMPMVEDYAQDHQTVNVQQQEFNNFALSSENIPIKTELVKSEVKIEYEDLGEEKESPIENNNLSEVNEHVNSVEFLYDSNNANTSIDTDFQALFNQVPKQEPVEETPEIKTEVEAPEKTDQIAHAMNAAGITTSESIPNTRAHALVNILSQKIRQGGVNSTQNSNTTNNYPKSATINAMALQQALAQILPPPLNQTGSIENNQQSQTSVTPQVLHIVQGKNSSGNQITLVDNSQQSVISNPNATPVLHIVQNKTVTSGPTSNGSPGPQTNTFSGISLVDAGLQQGGNQLLHIVNTGNQKNNNAGQLLKRVNLLTNLANVQGSNEQKMVQFVCKSADGKSIQLNAPHQRSMVLRLQPIETPSVQATPPKPPENQDVTSTQNASNSSSNKETAQQEIKSRSVYEENYAKFIQSSSNKPTVLEKSTSLPKFNQAFGKPVFQDNNQKNEINSNNSHLTANNNVDSLECQSAENSIHLDHIARIGSPPLLVRKPNVPTQAQTNLVQQIKQTIAPMNIQTMHGGVIYTRQIPVNIGGGQTINLITVPSTELIDDSGQKQVNQGDIEPSIIKIVPQSQHPSNSEVNSDDLNVNHDNGQNPQPQPVLTQMRIKLPMLSKAPQMVSGARVVRPSFFQIQRNVIGGTNQPVYQQLVLTAAPPLGQQTIRLPQAQARQIKVPENQSSSESQMSSSTLEQLREFDMVLEQVKERSTVQPNSNTNTSFKLHTTSTDTTDSPTSASSTPTETTQVLYSIGNNQPISVAYVNRKPSVTPTTSTFVRSPDSSGIVDSPTSSSVQIPHTVTTEAKSNETTSHPKPVKVKSKSRSKSSSSHSSSMKINSVPPKPSAQKPLEDEQTTQRILYILAEYKEQVENSPDKDKPAPRRRSNPPSNPGSSKRKKSSSGSRRSGRDMSPIQGEDTSRTLGSEDSSCGTSQGDCNESCLESHSPQDSPRKVVRKLTFEQETANQAPPKQQPQRNVIVADGQTITVARGTAGKPATAVLMPANYILPVSMVKGGQQIAIVTNRGPKLLTVGGEGGATNALLLQRLIGPAGLKPVLTRPGVRHVRLPTSALHNLQAFNLATGTTIHPPDSTASPASAATPPDLIETRAESSPWTERDSESVKPDRGSSPDDSEPWHMPSSADPHDYTYEETVRTDNMNRTVLDPIPDRYSPDMEAQRIFDKMFDVDSKKSYIVDSHVDSPRCAYDIDASDCDDKPYQVVQKKDGGSRQTRLTHVSSAALRHKYAILEHELRLQKSLSEECEDLGVDSPSASELFPEAELLFAASPAQDHAQDTPHHSHTPQPTIINQSTIQPDIDDQIATDQLIPRNNVPDDRQEIDVNLGLEDVGIVTVSEDGMQATIALDQEEFARAHPNTTFHSEPTDEGEVQPFTISGIKARHITSTIFHSNRAPATVLMTAPQTTVISQATPESSQVQNPVKYHEINNMIHAIPGAHTNNINLSSVLVKDDGLTRFDSILTDTRELHLSNTASAIIHSTGNATQVIRRVCYDDDKRERERFLIDEPDAIIAGDDAKMIAEDSSRDATLESMGGDVDDDNSSPERHAELFWESNSASERSESRRPLDFSSDSEKCCKSPSYDETNSTDSSGVGTHMRLDSVIKEARGIDRSGSADGSSADDTHPPLRTYPPKRLYHHNIAEMERSLTGKTRAGERSPDPEVRRRASGRGVVKRGCHCCNGSPAPPRTKKPRQRKPTIDFTN